MRIINTSPFSPDRMLKKMLDDKLIDGTESERIYKDLIDMGLDNRKKLYKFMWPEERID